LIPIKKTGATLMLKGRRHSHASSAIGRPMNADHRTDDLAKQSHRADFGFWPIPKHVVMAGQKASFCPAAHALSADAPQDADARDRPRA
jgi:hypothetical protein